MWAARLLRTVDQSGQELPSTAPGVHHEKGPRRGLLSPSTHPNPSPAVPRDPLRRLKEGLQSASMKRLSGWATLMALLSVGSASGDWVGSREAALKGRFFDTDVEEELLALRTDHRLQILRGERVVWSDEFPASYQSDPIGTCRDLASGLDRIVYVSVSGGSDGAMTLYLAGFNPRSGEFERLFSDRTSRPELARYLRQPEPSDPGDEWGLELQEGTICVAREYMARRERGLQVLQTLTALEPAG